VEWRGPAVALLAHDRGKNFDKAIRRRTVLPVLSTLLVRLWRSHRPGLLVAPAVAAVAYAVLLIWPISDLIATHDVGTIAAPMRAMQVGGDIYVGCWSP
jgi:hypothetical protein